MENSKVYFSFKKQAVLQIVLPAVVALLSIVIIYNCFIIPSIKDKLVASKEAISKDMVHGVVSMVSAYDDLVASEQLSLELAQTLAANTISSMRFGEDDEEYIWIHNRELHVVVHPYVKDGKTNNEKILSVFRKNVEFVDQQTKGFDKYDWRRESDSVDYEEKVSYISSYEPWGWIIGTGFFIKDIDEEVNKSARIYNLIFLLIVVLLAIVFAYIIHRSFRQVNSLIQKDKELEINEDRFRGLAMNIDEGLTIVENDKMVYANNRLCDIYNIQECDLRAFNYLDFVEEKYRIILEKYLTESRKEINKFDEIGFWINTRDGKRKFIINKYSYEKKHGNQYVYITTIDNTEKLSVEVKLKQLSQAVTQTPASIFITDTDGKIIYVNPGFEEITGYKAEEVMGKTPRIQNSGKMPQSLYVDLWNTIKKGEVWENEIINKKKNGDLIWVSTIISPIKNERHEIINFVAIEFDITVRKHIEEQLIKAKERAEAGERLKTSFLTNVSHEVRTPLNAIHGFAQLLKSLMQPTEKNFNYAQLIETNAKILLKLFDDIIEYSKIESNTLELRNEIIDLNVLILKLASKFNTRNISGDTKPIEIKLDKDPEEEALIVLADKYYLNKILENLISNSLKFTNEGAIHIGYVIRNNFIEFFVRDTGVGISKEEKDTIFDAFSHGTNKFVTLHKGTGLGLSITRRLIEMMGGNIWFDTKEEKGTIFHFTIPASRIVRPDDESMGKSEEDMEGFLSGKKILAVEDNEPVYLFLEALLTMYSADVLWAKNGKEAIDMLEEKDGIDIVFMDIMMPVMDGINATKIIRKTNTEIPIIALTAVEESILENEEKLFNGLIRKPVASEKLYAILKNVLG
ncbi:MAG: PAS domain S-box protein [Bacteroidales bacterium]|nr:PAS domain S-box protein [Bacteroidales bacterium]